MSESFVFLPTHIPTSTPPSSKMFAPPPIQLTKAQIEQAKLDAAARLEDEKKKKEEKERLKAEKERSKNKKGAASASSSPKPESPSPKRKNGLFNRRSKKLSVSEPMSPKVESPTPPPPPAMPAMSALSLKDSIERSPRQQPIRPQQQPPQLPPPPTEIPLSIITQQPRRAPPPPTSSHRSTRPPSDFFRAPHEPLKSPYERHLSPRSPPKAPLPALPPQAAIQRAPQQQQQQQRQQTPPTMTAPTTTVRGLGVSLFEEDEGVVHLPLLRPAKEPVLMSQRDAVGPVTFQHDAMGTEEESTVTSENSGRENGSNSSKLLRDGRRSESRGRGSFERSRSKRRGGGVVSGRMEKGEEGKRRSFVLVDEVEEEKASGGESADGGPIASREDVDMERLETPELPPTPSRSPVYLDKKLPQTPDSIQPTPTNLYHPKPQPRVTSARRPERSQRNPLAPISGNRKSKKLRKQTQPDNMSPSRLSAIPELMNASAENTPPMSGATTPTATQIYLSNGSVVTLVPPELTAWQRRLYVQGPIKLPKPTILPRKGSVASLEPFQEAIDQVYQEALVIPRRRSDDAVVDDICEWVDDFGFADVDFDGDRIMTDVVVLDDIDESDEMTPPADMNTLERFSTPPTDSLASPIEKVVAKEVVMANISRPHPEPIPRPPIPPVQTEETLRAKGIARLAQRQTQGHIDEMMPANNNSSNSSIQSRTTQLPALPAVQIPLPIIPPPPSEESVLEAELEEWMTDLLGSREEKQEAEEGMSGMEGADMSGFDWDDDVEEMDALPAWIAPASRHAFKRVRRLVSAK